MGIAAALYPPDIPRRPGDIEAVRPSFTHPPTVLDSIGGQQYSATAPRAVGAGLAPSKRSVLIDAGSDPLRAPALNRSLRRDMRRYLASDVTGAVRPQGRAWDVGAYEIR